MKRKLPAIVLLFALGLPTLYKAGFFAYFHLNRDYIAENYCVNKEEPITLCYGQCFLTKGLMFSTDNPHPEKLSSNVRAEVVQFFEEIVSFEIVVSSQTISHTSFSQNLLTEGITLTPLRPPIA